MSQLYASLFYQNEVTEIFSDRALVWYMIEAEVALARIRLRSVLFQNLQQPQFPDVAQTALDQIDFDALAVATGLAGKMCDSFCEAINCNCENKVMKILRAMCTRGAILSQEHLDTACILQCRAAMTQVEASFKMYRAAFSCKYSSIVPQVMIGRAWLQQGLPITLGINSHVGLRLFIVI